MTASDAAVGLRVPRATLQTVAFVLVLGAWIAVNVGWYLEHRAGQPKNIDELGYYTIALNNAFGLESGGVLGWVERIASPTIQAPLTTTVTSLLLPATDGAFGTGIAIVLASGAASIALLHALLRPIVATPVLWVGVACMATVPLFVQMSRQFAFAVPLCAVLLGALLALVRSRLLERTGPALVFGLLLGLIPLTRTMGTGFVPGFVVVAIAMALVGREGRRRRIRNLLLAGLVSAVVALPWYVANWQGITDYLTQYAYGTQADAYSAGQAFALVDLGWPFLSAMLPAHLVVLVAGWGLAAAVVVERLRLGVGTLGVRSWTAIAAAVVTVGGFAALASTSNDGTGFGLPLVAPALVVAAIGADRALQHVPRGRVWISAGSVVALVVASSGYFGVASAISEERRILLAGGGWVTLTDGTNDDQAYPFDSGILGGDPADGAAWQALQEDIVSTVTSQVPTSVAFGFRGAFVNVNSFQAAAMQRLGYPVAVAQIDPLVMDDGDDYRAWLDAGAAATSCVLLTSPGGLNEFPPVVDATSLDAAATASGFAPFATLTSPDGREIVVWSRALPGCPTYLEAQMLP